ncbi:ornithine decarboxylase [Bartonella sp. Coyote22sub2]|nr:ornithine decarboxylase [Bartonella sp. Coyote22sub2]
MGSCFIGYSFVFKSLEQEGIQLQLVNMGGGFPTRYLKDIPTVQTYGMSIFDALKKYFGNRIPETIIEPGRAMVGNAGVIRTEVVLISKKGKMITSVGFILILANLMV